MKQGKNILWNLLGLGIPLLIAALTVPTLITLVGAERFGFLALAWGLIGYAGILDLGIGRAVTRKISTLRDSATDTAIPDVIATAVRITLSLGFIAFVLILFAALAKTYLLIPRGGVSERELQLSMLLLAAALPMQAVSATYRGINEAFLNFKSINLIRIGLGAANFGAPFLAALLSDQLYWLVGTLVLSRAIALLFFRRHALRCLPMQIAGQSGRPEITIARELLGFGGWVTVSNVVSPFLVQADRFFVGALISASAVTLYVIPYEVTVQTLIIVGAVTTVAFPMFARLLEEDTRQARQVFRRWLFGLTSVMLPVLGALALLLPWLLRVWIGEHISADSIKAGQILCLGVMINAIGAMIYAFLHANGQAKMTALFHLAEAPLFVALLYFLITAFGVVGAAMAWTVRVSLDTALLAMGYVHVARSQARSEHARVQVVS